MPKRRLTAIRLDKIAAVDKPCQQHATVAIIKRAPDAGTPPAIVKKTFEEALRAQLVSDNIADKFWRAFENQYAIQSAFRTALADEISEGGDGEVATAAFTSAMQQLAAAAAEAAREVGNTADATLAAAIETSINKWLNQQEQTTMKITTKAQLKAEIAKFNPETSPAGHVLIIRKAATDLEAEDELPAEGLLAVVKADSSVDTMKREIAILKMAAPIRKHFDTLSEADQTKFLAKDEAGQQAEVDAIQKGDPIVYTCKDGTEIRKSDGAAAAMLAKKVDGLEGDLAKERGDGATDRIEKQAVEQFPNVAKAVAVDMLKSVQTLGADTAGGKAVMASLSTMNKAQSSLFKTLGSEEAPEAGDVRKGQQDFNEKVAEIAKRDSVGRSDAMSKARAEFPDLFKAAYPETEVEEVEA